MAPPTTARYDYFSASAAYEPADLMETFSEVLNAELKPRRAFNGYQQAYGLHVDGGTDPEVTIQFSREGHPNVLADGFPSQRIFEIMAVKFPNYGLARGDVAIDFDDAEQFEVIHAAMRTLSHQKGIRHSIIGDWETPGSPRGRTTEAGVRSGRRYRRLYEFSKAHGYGLPVRYELECKPDSRHKQRYALLSPIDLLRSDSYSVELLRRLGINLDRLTIARIDDRQPGAWFSHFAHQYGSKLLQLAVTECAGDFAKIGDRIQAELRRRRLGPYATALQPSDSDLPHFSRAPGCQPLAGTLQGGHHPPGEPSE